MDENEEQRIIQAISSLSDEKLLKLRDSARRMTTGRAYAIRFFILKETLRRHLSGGT